MSDNLLEKTLTLNAINHLPEEYPGIIISGRFQPPTKSHLKLIIEVAKKYPNHTIFVFIVKGKKTDLQKNPFSFNTIQYIMNKSVDESGCGNVMFFKSKTGFIGNFINFLREYKHEPKFWICGEDRKEEYQKRIDRYKEQLKLSCELISFDRDDNISGTKLRKAIFDGNIRDFQIYSADESPRTFFQLRKEIKNDVNDLLFG